MLYKSVCEKIAVDLKSLKLPVDNNQAKNILMAWGFIPVEFNLTRLARGLVGTSQYRRGALPHEAPEVVDCSGMVKWIYGQRGFGCQGTRLTSVAWAEQLVAPGKAT